MRMSRLLDAAATRPMGAGTGKTGPAVLCLTVLVLLAACGSAPVSTPADSSEIQTSALVDVRTGESFTLTSFPGKVTAVRGDDTVPHRQSCSRTY